MRGELCRIGRCGGVERITPAYAGRTLDHGGCADRLQDHPRVCGENPSPSSSFPWPAGSPPRMRGEPPPLGKSGPSTRITPAYAGRTRVGRSIPARKMDHPRVCGENVRLRRSRAGSVGSPPRMRGELSAGEPPVVIMPDHPRVCGENRASIRWRVTEEGSPPRMRGELVRAFEALKDGGITPAYAGRTCTSSRPSPAGRDHPRVCGENGGLAGYFSKAAGSPPRMRGEPDCDLPGHPDHRITPAYAGRTSS